MKHSYLQVAVESCSKISRVLSIIYIQGPPKGYKHYHYPVQTPKVPSGLLDQMLKMVELSGHVEKFYSGPGLSQS